jgi:hypothetical protein
MLGILFASTAITSSQTSPWPHGVALHECVVNAVFREAKAPDFDPSHPRAIAERALASCEQLIEPAFIETDETSEHGDMSRDERRDTFLAAFELVAETLVQEIAPQGQRAKRL